MDSGDSQITSRHHNLRIVFDRIHELYEQISSLPCGYVSRKTIKGKTRHYRQWRDKDGKVKGVYIKEPDYEAVDAGIERRRRLEGELAELEAYVQQSLRINTPEVRTFLIRYDRGKACRLSIEPDKGSQPIDCLPPVQSPNQSPAPSSSREILLGVAKRLVAQGILATDQIAEATGLSPDEIQKLEPLTRTARPSPPCQRNPPA